MSGWEGDFCAEGRDALGCAEFLERQYVRKSIVSARLRARLLYGRQSGAMACVWMRGILGEAVCEGDCCTEDKGEAMSCVTKRRILS